MALRFGNSNLVTVGGINSGDYSIIIVLVPAAKLIK